MPLDASWTFWVVADGSVAHRIRSTCLSLDLNLYCGGTEPEEARVPRGDVRRVETGRELCRNPIARAVPSTSLLRDDIRNLFINNILYILTWRNYHLILCNISRFSVDNVVYRVGPTPTWERLFDSPKENFSNPAGIFLQAPEFSESEMSKGARWRRMMRKYFSQVIRPRKEAGGEKYHLHRAKL